MAAFDPIKQAASWIRRGRKTTRRGDDPAVLATTDRKGRPSARVILLKGVRDGGFRFFTNYESRKANELGARPYAALVFYWPTLDRQLRVEGRVRKLPAADSDAYWATRPRSSQLGAIASRQSQVLADWSDFLSAVRVLDRQLPPSPVARPKNWGGYQLVPDRIEFWVQRADRLHQRVRYRRQRAGRWVAEKLYP